MIIRGSETVLVQGITGKQGTFWSERMRDYGTKIIGGVNPKRAGETHASFRIFREQRKHRSERQDCRRNRGRRRPLRL